MSAFALLTFVFLAGAAAQRPRTYTSPGVAGFDPKQAFKSVGVFGSFGIGTEVRTRPEVGLPTFTVWRDPAGPRLKWSAFKDGSDFELGQVAFPGAEKQEFLDWCTARWRTGVYLSRCFPALLTVSPGSEWVWRAGEVPFTAVAYRHRDGRLRVLKATSGLLEIDGADLGSPWLLLWNQARPGEEVVPFLMRFEKRPTGLSLEMGLSLTARFQNSAGAVGVMPLLGIARAAKGWSAGPPAEAQAQADFWTRAMAAFPTSNDESFVVEEDRQTVEITNRFSYREMKDDWGTKPLRLAPVPPVVAVAEANGYPVKWLDGPIERSPVATFLGPYAFREGSEIRYEIPIPSARDHVLAPIRVRNAPALEKIQSELESLVKSRPYESPDFSEGGLNLTAKEHAQAYLLLDEAARTRVRSDLTKALKDAYAPENLQTVIDPVTGQSYAMCDKIWCAKEPYDREWYAGRQLDATAEIVQWVDPDAARPYWKEIQGLYAYFRIYSDWSWSGVYSSVLGYNECADGMNFAMEGMLGVARMARLQGGEATWKDATYRAARQALSTAASYSMPEWVKKVDFATITDTSYDYEAKKGRYRQLRQKPEDVITGFGIDIYSDSNGIRTLRPGSFWHACSAVYWNNPALYRLQAECAYERIRRWEYETMPALHPAWLDTKAVEVYENQPYGNNHSLTLIEARALLFGEDPLHLKAMLDGLSPAIPVHFRIRTLQSVVQAGVPQAWVPINDARLDANVWDGEARKLTVTLIGVRNAAASLDWTWRQGTAGKAQPGPRPSSVTVDGVVTAYREVPGGFWRLDMRVRRSATVTVEIAYGGEA